MKPQLVDRSNRLNGTFSEKKHSFPHFFKVWHYHSEIELVLITQSTGTFLIGDEMERFKPGDLFLVGSNVPHILLNDQQYFLESSDLRAEAMVVHFDHALIHNNIFDLPEAVSLKPFLEHAKRAMKFSSHTSELIKEQIESMFNMTSYQKILTLMKMFQILAEDTDSKVISSIGFSNNYRIESHRRMDRVYDYIFSNFKDHIELKKLAEISNMNKSSFCRYFKKMNNKTISRYVNELRIGYACKLLQENRCTISEACYDSGFNNVSNFNRQFRSIMNQTPSEYSKKYSNPGPSP